jgi:hypothetical protein
MAGIEERETWAIISAVAGVVVAVALILVAVFGSTHSTFTGAN